MGNDILDLGGAEGRRENMIKLYEILKESII